MALFRCASGGGGGGQITVTYDSDFYGETITCTRGQKVYSKVASSSGSVVFVVNEEGDWLIECTIGQDTYSTTASIEFTTSTELVSIPDGSTVLPTDDVETWLACAGIQDKAYTTLSQVLADSETFNALLGDSNACAYMARSTTWSTDICASQYAMSMIGQYDVCCDALMSDSNWASAIASSAYADYVLASGMIPTMTSNTTPSGVCTASAIGGDPNYEPYKAFDGKTNTKWYDVNNANMYIQYEFPTAVVVKTIMFRGNTDAPLLSPTQIIVKGSNDGSTFTPLDTISNIPDDANYHASSFANATAYKYYRLDLTGRQHSDNNTYAQLSEIQFWGEITNTEKIHGTNNESAYYLDGATQTPIVDPSTLSAGTYTFGSTVAKDPSDLTADYTKTIRITPNTKEIVLRPDNSLYWWGYESPDLEDLSSANGWNWNYTFTAPTHQTYGIIMQGFSDYGMQGVGGKTNYNVHSVKTICESVSAPSGYAQLALQTSKNISDGSATISAVDMVNGLSTITSDSLAYIRVESAGGNNTVTLKAFWYE
jgi:hypothetical protein